MSNMGDPLNIFLKEANLTYLYSHFVEQEVDLPLLQTLNDVDLASLIPKVGQRAKIKNALKNLSDITDSTVTALKHNTSTASTVILEVGNVTEFDTDDVSTIEINREDLEMSPSPEPDLIFRDTQQQNVQKKQKLDTSLNDTHNNEIEKFTDYKSPEVTATVQSSLKKTEHVGQEKSNLKCFNCKDGEIFKGSRTVKQLLEATTKGNVIMQHYQNNQKLNPKDRSALVALLIDAFFESHETARGGYLQRIAHDIQELFPTESSDTYFFCNTKVSKNPKGKLADRYRNELAFRKKNSCCTMVTKEAKLGPGPTDKEETRRYVSWLQHNNEPWSQVLSYWGCTFHLRNKDLQSDMALNEILKKWPILKHNKGSILINHDFNLLHPGKGDALFINWGPISQWLMSKISNENLEKIKALSDIAQDVHKFKILPTLFRYGITQRSVASTSKNALLLRPSVQECSHAFISIVPDAASMILEVESHRGKCAQKKATVQPRIFFVEQVEQCYLKLDDYITYTSDDIIRCVDLAFKTHTVLNLHYERRSLPSFTALQRAVYQISTESDTISPSTAVVIKEIESLTQSKNI